MADPPNPDRALEIFFQVFEPLPRQGPGSRASLERALALCDGLPSAPAVLDLGCGSGAQTLQLAELTGGSIVAMDSHGPSIERLRRTLEERGLDRRIRAEVGDMSQPELDPGSFDLIWSEGALYNIGIDTALRLYAPVLRPGGYLVFTEPVWRKENPPEQVAKAFAEYEAMGFVRDVLEIIEASGLEPIGHFPLPDQDWWTDFYTPMEQRIADLRREHADDPEALAVLDDLAREPRMHRDHGAYYGYEFFVVRKPA